MASYVYKLFQTCLLIFNSFYFLIGISFVLISVSSYINTTSFNQLVKENHSNEYYLFLHSMLISGLIYIAVGVLGCFGGFKRNLWIIFFHFTFLLIIFSLQFTLCICIYIKSEDFWEKFVKKFNESIKLLYGTNHVLTNAIDHIHRHFKCCGWLSPQDWFYSSYDSKHQKSYLTKSTSTNIENRRFNMELLNKIPFSCCVNDFDVDCIVLNKFHEIGCERPIKIYYQQIEIYTIWLLACLTILQLVLLILSLYLLCMSWADKKLNKNGDNSIGSTSISSSISLNEIKPEENRVRQQQVPIYPPNSYYL